jgi:Ras GTPase-activating-like protein IQGAP2/3
MADRIGNLLGQLRFSDDQLQKTQKGLKEAGVSMPNFSNVGRELAKEINEEPDEEPETEDEREGFTERLAPRSANSHSQAETVCS